MGHSSSIAKKRSFKSRLSHVMIRIIEKKNQKLINLEEITIESIVLFFQTFQNLKNEPTC